LIIEWKKVQATLSVSDAEEKSYLAAAVEGFLEDVDIEILELVSSGGGAVPVELRGRLKGYDCVIAGVYSRSPAVEQLQAEGLKEILEVRGDVIVVALGNPYDIRNFPFIDTYVVTYGFRQVQVEALFKVLTGQIKPTGRLPVQIRNLFPRGFAFHNKKFCGGPGGGFSKEPPGRRSPHAGGPYCTAHEVSSVTSSISNSNRVHVPRARRRQRLK
jgi:hypothetical protein